MPSSPVFPPSSDPAAAVRATLRLFAMPADPHTRTPRPIPPEDVRAALDDALTLAGGVPGLAHAAGVHYRSALTWTTEDGFAAMSACRQAWLVGFVRRERALAELVRAGVEPPTLVGAAGARP